jgi:hypothetical protein
VIDHVEDQRRLAGAGDAHDRGEAESERDGEVTQVVLGRAVG